MNYEYYYNNVPGLGQCRNNLIYTSLISEDKKTFVQWYHNDTDYHKGQNQVVDIDKMDEKWQREVKYLQLMRGAYPDLVPRVLDIDHKHRKIYLQIDGVDFWERAGCVTENYNNVLPKWRSQMIEINKAHQSLGLYKFSMHPSSYFVVNGQLKSINYFFTYHKSENNISIRDVESHIYSTRQAELRKYLESLGISWDAPQPFDKFQRLCWESFRTNYPEDFIKEMIESINDI
jgi:hypothetical protein